jgi:hypothetical protein
MSDLVYSHGSDSRRISNKSEFLRTDGESIFIGEGSNKTIIGRDGVMYFRGKAVVWDEISNSVVGKNIFVNAGKIDYNFSELTLDFSDNALYPSHEFGVVSQMSHARMKDSDIRPHIHWMQTSDNNPNILIKYRWISLNQVPTAWVLKALTAADNKFTFAESGHQQITEFNLPEGNGVGRGMSATFECMVYRDTTNASGLFAGADTYIGDWSVKYYDIHILMDAIGSREEFVK